MERMTTIELHEYTGPLEHTCIKVHISAEGTLAAQPRVPGS